MKVVASYDNIQVFRHMKVVASDLVKCMVTHEYFTPRHLMVKYRMSTDVRDREYRTWTAIEARLSGDMVDPGKSGHRYGDRTYLLTNPNACVPHELALIIKRYKPSDDQAA